MRRAAPVSAVTLSACSPGSTYDYKAAVKAELRDPASAQFSDVTINGESACGFVNSKNGYGGYSGKQPFVAIGTKNVRIIEGNDMADSSLVAARCEDPALGLILAWMVDYTMQQQPKP